MKLLTTEQLAEIDKRHEALTQWYANADKERGFHKGKAGAENQSHHDREALREHIKALTATSKAISELQRYEIDADYNCHLEIDEDKEGDWVRFEDVIKLTGADQ